MLFFGRELTKKGRSLKTQMMISSNKCEVVKSSERIWYDHGFFSDQRADFNLSKNIFPENALVYVNQGTISTVKNDLAIYINCFILDKSYQLKAPQKALNLTNVNKTKQNSSSHCMICQLEISWYRFKTGLYCFKR